MPERELMRLIWVIVFAVLVAIGREVLDSMNRMKHKAEANGFVASSMLGPLGVYIAAYFYNRKKCPICRKKIERNTELCPHCGFPVPSA